MNTKERLKRIKEKCRELLAIAEKRTPGKWSHWPTHWAGGNNSTQYDGKNNCPWVSAEESPAIEVARINPKGVYTQGFPMGNAAFIASCAGPAEAGWRATIAAIEQIQSMRPDTPTWEFVGKPMQSAILSAWPEELL